MLGSLDIGIRVGQSALMFEWPTWTEWLDTLEPAQRSAAVALSEAFGRLGADDPEGWARSEVMEDIPHLARYLAVHQIWERDIDRWGQPDALRSPVVTRLLASGAATSDVVQLARLVAYETAFSLLYSLTAEGDDDDSESSMPGWTLVERVSGRLTGRVVGSLHEDLLSMDPSGNEGSDLWR